MAKNLTIYRIALLIPLCAFLVPALAWSYPWGPPDGYAGDPPNFLNCTTCHYSFPVNSGDGQLQLLGLPQEYVPDSTYDFTITLQDTGQSRWGFELTAILANGNQGGILQPVDTSMVQISVGADTLRDYLKHTLNGTQAGQQSGSWQIQWTAPAVSSGDVSFYMAGNAANRDDLSTGDYIYTISADLPEMVEGIFDPGSGQPITPALASAYPNPFNPSTTISYSLPRASVVRLTILDINGRGIAELVSGWRSAGSYEAAFDGSNLTSGIYVYSLEAGAYKVSGKLVLLK